MVSRWTLPAQHCRLIRSPNKLALLILQPLHGSAEQNVWRRVTSAARGQGDYEAESGNEQPCSWCPMLLHKPMTFPQARSVARHLGLTLRQVCSGGYRVNFRDGNETTSYYTDNLKMPSIPRLRWPVGETVVKLAVPRRLNKFLAQSNKSRAEHKATNKSEKAQE